MTTRPLACSGEGFTAELLERRFCFSNETNFVDLIDNTYLPLIPGTTYIYRGTDDEGQPIRSRVTVSGDKKRIDGVTTTVVRDRQYVDRELVEDTRDYYAQDDLGNVWHFGREVRLLASGGVLSTEGSWEAGIDGAEAGIIMKAQPRAGDVYRHEIAPGETAQEIKVAGFGERARVPFATFGDCLKTEVMTAPSLGHLEHRFYAPGIGAVMVQTVSGGSDVLRLAYVNLAPEAFADKVDNPYFPLTPGTTLIYRGVDHGVPLRQRVTVTHETKQITGVTTTVVRVREYTDGEMLEDTLDYYAQDKAGNVWYFGEQSRQFEDGTLVGTEGSWEAGVDGATPGIFMRVRPSVGDVHRLENAPGVAEDQARILGIDYAVKVPFASFQDCLRIEASTPLDSADLELKFFAPGIGFIMEEAADGEDQENMKLAYVIIE